jgi:hypothetical protein
VIYRFSRQILVLILSFICIVVTIQLPIGNAKKTMGPSSDLCYGYIVPLPATTFTTNETLNNTQVRHLINDLLRLHLSVYWSSTSFLALSQPLGTTNISVIYYAQGSFFIPFSGDDDADAMLTAIIFDYQHTHEIDSSGIPVDIFQLMEPLSGGCYQLVEPKIAQHFGNASRYGWPFYLQMAENGEFLNFELLDDTDTAARLNNNDFNVFVWPYNPTPSTNAEVVKTLENLDNSNAIRRFIRDGGSYIGSCYGAEVASSGILWPIALFSLRNAYNPLLSPRFPFIYLSLSDTLMAKKILGDHPLYTAAIQIDAIDHPLAFGVNTVDYEVYNGPWFEWLGKNSRQLATFLDIQVEKNATLEPHLKKQVVGAPAWVESQFGNGTVILFGAHPEFVNNLNFLFQRLNWTTDHYAGRRVIHNAFLYTPSQKNMTFSMTITRPCSWINSIGVKTDNLPIMVNPERPFEYLKQRLWRLNQNLSYLSKLSRDILDMLPKTDSTKKTVYHENVIYPLTYTYRFCSLLQNFHNTTSSYLDLLANISMMSAAFDPSVPERIMLLTRELSDRLNSSESILASTITLTTHIKESVLSPNIVTRTVVLLHEPLFMERSFSLSLKYSPQTSFSTLKLVRSCWYQYEAAIALS